MQKWEYKLIIRYRTYKAKNDAFFNWSNKDWKTSEDGIWKKVESLEKYLDVLGGQGWELVSVVGESGVLGGSTHITGSDGSVSGDFKDFAGFTDTEKFFFKRPKE